jgi:hypothetical protein
LACHCWFLAVDNINMAIALLLSGGSDKMIVMRWKANAPQTTAETAQKRRQII